MLLFSSLPLIWVIAIFTATAAVVWLTGTRLSYLADAISERTGVGRAFMGLIFLAFEISHMGNVTVDLAMGKMEKARDRMNKVAVSDLTPVLAVENYLNKVYKSKNPPTGLVFNTYEMGDYLTFAGPGNMKLFLNSHAHMVPNDVWTAYMGISEFGRNWESDLARYGVNMVIMDNVNRGASKTFFYESGKWNLDYQDATVSVYVRKQPI